MNSSDLRDALRRDAELVGEPPSDLLERVEDLRRRSNRRRTGVVASTLGVALVVAAIPVGGVLLDQPAGGNVAAPANAAADAPAPAAAEPTTPSLEQQRADAAEMFGITDPPDVPVIALVRPEQKEALVTACMAEHGYAPTEEGHYAIPNAELAAFHRAEYICDVSYPIDPALVGVPADEDRIIN
ncbi:hypothetical protein [Blastococcus montanus]|uniref:hypothetical protein n=1 Tax=Blastococcus montanus TaxID=3144973 RepID=UPI00320A67D1